MRAKQSVESPHTVNIWRRLPALNVATLCTVLKPYRSLSNDTGNFGNFIDSELVVTGKELIDACVREDIGESVLHAEMNIVEAAMKACVRASFAETKQSYDEIVTRAAGFLDVPSRHYQVERIRSLRCAFLQNVGENLVQPNHGLPAHPRMWDAATWHTYLYANPTEVFRITTLVVVQHVAKLAPTIATPSIHRLFSSFFPAPRLFAGETWQDTLQSGNGSDEPWKDS
ncbi:MAG: hypothetical protein AAB515_02925 [Patescibacteria group bacterium]